jgi:hypothetical protein
MTPCKHSSVQLAQGALTTNLSVGVRADRDTTTGGCGHVREAFRPLGLAFLGPVRFQNRRCQIASKFGKKLVFSFSKLEHAVLAGAGFETRATESTLIYHHPVDTCLCGQS